MSNVVSGCRDVAAGTEREREIDEKMELVDGLKVVDRKGWR